MYTPKHALEPGKLPAHFGAIKINICTKATKFRLRIPPPATAVSKNDPFPIFCNLKRGGSSSYLPKKKLVYYSTHRDLLRLHVLHVCTHTHACVPIGNLRRSQLLVMITFFLCTFEDVDHCSASARGFLYKCANARALLAMIMHHARVNLIIIIALECQRTSIPLKVAMDL